MVASADAPLLKARPLLSGLFVAPEWRRRGVASLLVANAELLAGKWGFDELMLTVSKGNEAAVSLYTHLGFVEAPPSAAVPRWREVLAPPDICMRKGIPD